MSSEAGLSNMTPEQVLREVAQCIDEASEVGEISTILREAGWDSVKHTLIADRGWTPERYNAIRTAIAAAEYLEGPTPDWIIELLKDDVQLSQRLREKSLCSEVRERLNTLGGTSGTANEDTEVKPELTKD